VIIGFVTIDALLFGGFFTGPIWSTPHVIRR